MYLLQRGDRVRWLPFREDIDATCYRAVMLGFPCMALVLILGAAWGNIAWGRYWGWDPKETAALTTWLIYAGYLHAHSIRSWRGVRSSLLLLVGFGATLFTYYGNLFLGGLHAYSGL
jgi:ABC-type transport system involved in cytochrome c biogenesis permease subunit